MKVLVTGGAGYIGSTLIRMLLEQGHQVVCLDRFFFGQESIANVLSNPNLKIVKDDIRWFNPSILKGIDVVMDFAALSNDPAGELDPAKTLDINYLGRARVAKLSKEYGVKRYILASSCSIYGFREDMILDETSPTNPLTTYAKANEMAEEDNLRLNGNGFVSTVLRQATVYGSSYRMRFDLAINGMTLGVFRNKKIPVMRDGGQWRPFIHVKDTSQAFIDTMEADPEKVAGEIFNVGSDEQNYQIKALVDILAQSLPVKFEVEWYGDVDNRSYRVSFSKIKKTIAYRTRFTPKEGSLEIFNALKDGKLTDSMKTRTVEWYKHLLASESLVKEVLVKDTIL